MQIETKTMGKIEISEDRIIRIPQGLFGFEEYSDFLINFSGKDKHYLASFLFKASIMLCFVVQRDPSRIACMHK